MKKKGKYWTIKKIFRINKLTYIFALISVFTASYREFFIISFLIVIHEIGHFLMAYILNVEVKEIYLYPLGGISKFNMELNINPLKELLILIMGPIFQVIAYYILLLILPSKKEIITIYNYSILGFNLLPIYPLDGGKLIKVLLDNFISYKNSFKITIYFSYLVLLIILLINRSITINFIIMSSLLLILITKEYKRIECYYQKFILERYLNSYKFKKSKIINNDNNFYRNKKHIINKNNKYYLEKEYLDKIYKKM